MMKRTLNDEAPMRERGDVRCPRERRTQEKEVAGGPDEKQGRCVLSPVKSCSVPYVVFLALFLTSWRPAGGSYHISPHVRRFGIDERFLIEKHFPNRERIRAGRVSAFNGRSYQNYQKSAVMQHESGCDEVER